MQVFHRSTNVLSRFTIFGGLFVIAALVYALALINRSPYVTRQGVAREQPVQFSHKHHVGELGIDCRYCHTTVEKLAYAGMPATKTCMNCHSQIWATSDFLEPVRESWRTDESIRWVKVYDLPEYVYFNHSIHVSKGVGCASCHGRVDLMNALWQQPTLQMEWCLECHRAPERHLRPRQFIFSMDYQQPADQIALGEKLKKEYDVEARVQCSACHR
ncbi:MAG: cytochrome c3 family protein [Thermodesulfobacteriota bacterium]